ncbi:hypothetical protein MKEN_00008100 [Mycena kentingensis (nom. inval.)]|nr:hypothetical protein MKEN_00008100 [Mycena kentingensis (nom. inval.)]
MVPTARRRLSDEETYQARLAAANEQDRADMTKSLKGIIHLKKQSRGAARAHDRTLDIYDLLVAAHPEKKLPKREELVEGVAELDDDTLKEYARLAGHG